MTRRIAVIPAAVFLYYFLFFPLVHCASAAVSVMPEQYTFVATGGSLGSYGGIEKWDHIVLWGRAPQEYSGYYEYRWDYGNGSGEDWKDIDSSAGSHNGRPYYLSSDSYNGYSTRSNEAITYYTAKLFVRNKASGIVVSTSTVMVKAVDFTRVVPAYGYADGSESTRLILQSIAKGRALTWLYCNQKSDGSWPGTAVGWGNYSVGGTGLALAAFLVHGHSVYDPGGEKDIFTETVERGLAYLFSKSKLIKYDTLASSQYPCDINNNGYILQITDCTSGTPYEHGIAMLALAACFNAVRASGVVPVLPQHSPSSWEKKYTYRDAVADAVDWAVWAQSDDDVNWTSGGIRGWRYYANYPGDPHATSADLAIYFDMSATQWPILGMAAIQEVWQWEAPAKVREHLLWMVRCVQYQNATANTGRDGGATYNDWHGHCKPYSGGVTFNVIGAGGSEDYWLVGTNSLLQVFHYLSLSTDASTDNCGCGASLCANKGSDFTIDASAMGNSCIRVTRAINYIARNFDYYKTVTLGDTTRPNMYVMYGIMKALRLYNYQKHDKFGNAGINGGILPGRSKAWEDEFAEYLLTKQDPSDGHFEDNFGKANGDLATAWAVLILSETVFHPSAIKSELIFPRKVKTASLR